MFGLDLFIYAQLPRGRKDGHATVAKEFIQAIDAVDTSDTMTWLQLFKNKITPRQFFRVCLLFVALWLVVMYPVLLVFCPAKLPVSMKPQADAKDFYQYYAGAVVVRYGIWNSLYSEPKKEVYDQPNHFTPRIQTPLFNPKSTNRELAFYPALNIEPGSDWPPELIKKFPQAKWHSYIYPPPTALLFWPLSFVDFDFAQKILWPTISIWSFFALSFFASKIHRFLRQADSYTEGLIVLACGYFTCFGRTHVVDGNVSPLLAGLVAYSCYALIRGHLFAFSCAYMPLILCKSIGLTWLPLLFIHRAYRRIFIYLSALALILNGIVLGLGGIGVYEKFFSLAPKIAGIPVGVGIVSKLLHDYGFFPHTIYFIFNLVCLFFLYYGYWKKEIKNPLFDPTKPSPLFVVALLAGTMAVYCLTNYVVWFPYCPDYLFFPFLGWILQEGYLASGRWRGFILGGVALFFFALTGESLLNHLLGAEHSVWFRDHVCPPASIVFIPAFFLLIALRRLLTEISGIESEPESLGPIDPDHRSVGASG